MGVRSNTTDRPAGRCGELGVPCEKGTARQHTLAQSMKRTQPDATDSRDTSRRRTSAAEWPHQYVRAYGFRKGTTGPDRVALLLFTSWSRAERGQGSEADVALWERFAAIDPAEPQAASRAAALLGIRPSALVYQIHENLWQALTESPAVNQYLGDRATTPLPAVADLIEGAMQLLGSEYVDGIVPYLSFPGQGWAIKTLVQAMAKVLDARPMVEWMATDAPFYAVPMPPGSWAPALHAFGTRCDDRRAYYVLLVRFDDESAVFLSGPHSATEHGRSHGVADHVWVRDTNRVDPGMYLDAASLASYLDIPGGLAEWLPLLLIAIGDRPEWTPVPWLNPPPAGAAQIKSALVPVNGIDAIPPTTTLSTWIVRHIQDVAAIRSLAGAWIDGCQLLAALAVFAGQAAARRALPMFEERPPTLFDAAVDAAAASFDGGQHPVLPDDLIERSAPRLWQRVCAAPATKAGLLSGAHLLPQAARVVGVPVGEAEADRPELLCAPLAAHTVPAQAVRRYESPVAPAPTQTRLAGKRDARGLRDIWVRSCESTAPLSDSDVQRIEAAARSIKVDLPSGASALCAFMAPAMVGPALPEIEDPKEEDEYEYEYENENEEEEEEEEMEEEDEEEEDGGEEQQY
nr:hypothetical protein [Pandoravirus aubagnensis]